MSNLAASCFFGKNSEVLHLIAADKALKLKRNAKFEFQANITEIKLVNNLQKIELVLIGNKSRLEKNQQDTKLSALSRYSRMIEKGECLIDSNQIFLKLNDSGTYLYLNDPGLKDMSDSVKQRFFELVDDYISGIKRFIQV